MENRNERQVTILYTNDIHGRNRPFWVTPGNATSQTGDPGQEWDQYDREGWLGGFPALAAAVRKIRQARGAENVLLIDGGDTFSDDLLGNLTKGEAVIQLMNQLGYQYMALGNHDFDYGYERTRALQEIARFPMRAANVVEKENGQPFMGEPVETLKAGGITVGIIGLGYPNTHLTGNKKNYEILRFEDGIEITRRWLPQLRQQADLVVVLSHMGTALDRQLAQALQDIDLIIGGHSHDRIESEKIGRVHLTQAVADASVLGETVITMQGEQIKDITSHLHTLWLEDYPEDETTAALLNQLRAPYKDQLEEIIATAEAPIGRNYRSESPFDRLVGEILCKETGAQAAFMPGVGYGVTLYPGPITREALYTLLPHPAKMVSLELTGQQILATLEQSAENQALEDPRQVVGGILQTAGIHWTIDFHQPVGKRVKDVLIGDRPLELERAYPVVTNAGILAGLHRYHAFGEGKNIQQHDISVTEVVEKAFRAMGTVRLPNLGEIKIIKRGAEKGEH